MAGFDDREKAQEGAFAYNQKISFEAEAKASKLFGLWIAEQIGLEDADAATYAAQMVETNLDEPGFEDVLRKARKDLEEKGVEVSEHMLQRQLSIAMEKAAQLIAEEE